MSSRTLNLIIASVLAIVMLSIFANSMTKPLSHDEQMFTAAGALVSQGKTMYRDFSYAGHLPYHSLILAGLYKIFNTTHYLLIGRILSCVCDIITMLCIVVLYRKILKPYPVPAALLGMAAAVLYVFNPAVLYASGYAWNHNITITCVVAAATLFILMDKTKLWCIAAISALLTFATAIRITTALAEVCFFIMILMLPSNSLKQKLKTIFIFLLATVVVLIYPIYIIAQAPQAFLLNLLKIPSLNGQWQQMINAYVSNPNIANSSMMVTVYSFLFIIAIVLGISLICRRHNLEVTNVLGPLLIVTLIVVFFVIALVPATTWEQYLALPVPFIIIAFAFPVLYLRKLSASPAKNFNMVVSFFLICSILSVGLNINYLQKILSISNPQEWTALKLHNISKDIAKNTVDPQKILTLGPLYALEGGCDIYDQLSAGPFVYRVAEGLSREERALTKTIAADQLKLLFACPPCAVILGAEPAALEQALFDAAVKPDWQRKAYDSGIVVYFKP